MLRPNKEERIKYNVDYASDTDYSAYARLLQSKWRDSKSYPMAKLGNYLDIGFAKETKCNYLTENIKKLVEKRVREAKIEGALIGEPRIWNNLLSSQPLCFNLFGELHFDLELATNFFRSMFPDRVETVTSVKFEHSLGRGNAEYTGDHSAFDVFIEYETKGKKGFIGIEVKYAESLREETKSKAEETLLKHEKEYTRLTTDAHFIPNAIQFVSKVPISQIWRDHLLSIAHLKDYDEGFFVFLFPKDNVLCQQGVDEYKKYLNTRNENETGFYPRHLDDFIENLILLKDAEWTKELASRYLGKF